MFLFYMVEENAPLYLSVSHYHHMTEYDLVYIPEDSAPFTFYFTLLSPIPSKSFEIS